MDPFGMERDDPIDQETTTSQEQKSFPEAAPTAEMHESSTDEENRGIPLAEEDEEEEAESECSSLGGEPTWSEVAEACCVHSAREWQWTVFGILLTCCFLYVFLWGLELLSSGAKVMAGCKAGSLFGDDSNPLASVMIGILSTVLLQSSSTTTSIIVSMVGSVISTRQGIFMVMGANIGTSVTNTLVAMGQVGNALQLERAFAGATVHDMFNFMSVAILMPLEIATGYLEHLTAAITKEDSLRNGDHWEGPIKKIVAPLGNLLIISNKDLTKAIAKGEAGCDDFYPMACDPNVDPPTYDSCQGTFGLIKCDKENNRCPAFFQADASARDDKVSGGVVFVLGIITLFFGLAGVVAVLNRMLLDVSTHVIFKATNVNGYLAIAIGAGITMVVQSSSITTSTLTPLVGIGALPLEQMYPLTLGANIGTTLTGIMAALVSDEIEALQVALAHLFFNITGIIIFYPVPYMRAIPMTCARNLGRMTHLWKGFPILYITTMFLLLPLFILGLSALFEQEGVGFKVLGSFIVILIAILAIYWGYWCKYSGGAQACVSCLASRDRQRVTLRQLPDDMDYVKETLAALVQHTALPVDDDGKYTPGGAGTVGSSGDVELSNRENDCAVHEDA